MPRLYTDEEVEVLETVAMLLAQVLAAAGASDASEEGLASALPRTYSGDGPGSGYRGRTGVRSWDALRSPRVAGR